MTKSREPDTSIEERMREAEPFCVESAIDTMVIDAKNNKQVIVMDPSEARIELFLKQSEEVERGIDVTNPSILGKYYPLYNLANKSRSIIYILPGDKGGGDQVLFLRHKENLFYGKKPRDLLFSLKDLETAIQIIPVDTNSKRFQALQCGFVNGGSPEELQKGERIISTCYSILNIGLGAMILCATLLGGLYFCQYVIKSLYEPFIH